MAVLFGLILPRARRRRLRGAPITLVPIRDLTPPPRPRRTRPVEQAVAPTPAPFSPPQVAEAPAAQRMTPNPTVAVAPAAEYPPLRLEVGGTTESVFISPASEGRTPPFRPSAQVFDGTLQFLPGRMEMIEGSDTGQDVRFVRAPAGEPTTITFGRAPGTPYRHVQLHEATVSRHHARMTLAGKNWELTNLSQTNPVIVNGEPMRGEGDTVTLEDGDRVEMGEVVFRFHAT